MARMQEMGWAKAEEEMMRHNMDMNQQFEQAAMQKEAEQWNN